MQGKNFLLASTVNVSAISPLFVGTKSPNYGWGLWSLGDRENYIYIIDQPKFRRYLDENHLLDNFIERYSDPKSFANNENWVNSFLNDNKVLEGMNLADKKEVAKRISSGVIYNPGSVRGPFIRSGKGRVYLPGSSIKGAFRTAFTYSSLKIMKKDKPDLFTKMVENTVRRKIGQYQNARDRNRFKQTFDQEIIRSVLYPPGKTLANDDLFRFVKISDGEISSGRSETGKAVVLNIGSRTIGLKSRNDGRPISIPCEYLQSGAKIHFKVAIDLVIYNQIKKDFANNDAAIYNYLPDITTVDDLLKVVKEFAEDQWIYEKTYTDKRLSTTMFKQLPKYYQAQSEGGQKPFLRLGWGTGMMGMTIDMLFDSNPDGSGGLREEIRNISTPRRGEPAPKSRRLLDRNGNHLPFGWLKQLSSEPLEAEGS